MPGNKSLFIAGREVSHTAPPYIIAEMSGNHNGDLERAKELISAAAAASADAVKLQTYTPDTITIKSDRPEFSIDDGLWEGRTLYELYGEAHTPWEWHGELFDHAAEEGVTIFSSPFDLTAVDFLSELGVPAFKIASAEIIDWGLLEKVASTGKPIVMSTGMASLQEIEEALNVLRTNGCDEVAIFHCISAYPTPIDQANLNRIVGLREHFDVLVGLSDHTMGLTAGITAAALGAPIFEKHFTLKRADGGVDSAFSLEQDELKNYCEFIRDAHSALGNGDLGVAESDQATRNFRRSLYFVDTVEAGETITENHIRSIRPGNGLLPKHLKDILGRKAARKIMYGEPSDWSMIETD